ncbi:MAG: PQQ-binding-like beta-propeller repeat protein [Planctomycetota bacterium]
MKLLHLFRVSVCMVLTIVITQQAVFSQEFDDQKFNNWHQWRGPNADGLALSGNPPISWGQDENIKWKIPIPGEGSSTPIVWEDQVFILAAIPTNQKPDRAVQQHVEAKTKPPEVVMDFAVFSFDRNTGKQNWKKILVSTAPFEGRHPSTTYAASSPTTDGQHIYVLFGSYGVFCLDMGGNLMWERDLGNMRTRRGWGEAVSPVLYDDKLVVMWDQEEDSQIFVLDADNGNTIWSKDRDEPTTWATPLVTRHKNRLQLITNGTEAIRSYDLATGEIIWQTTGTTLNAIPCPVRYEDNVILMAGYRGNRAVSIPLASATKNGKASLDVAWDVRQHTPYVTSPLVLGNRIYFTKSLVAILNCLDVRTGKPIFELTRMPGLNRMYASPVAAKDRIYFTSREGTTLVIKDSDKLEILATNRLDEEIDASPAIVGNQIFLRSKKHLYCIEE